MSEQQVPSPEVTPVPPAPNRPEPPITNPYTPGKLFGIAVLGAGCSLVAYYLFQQLGPEQKRRIRGQAVRGVKTQVRGWINRDEEPPEPT